MINMDIIEKRKQKEMGVFKETLRQAKGIINNCGYKLELTNLKGQTGYSVELFQRLTHSWMLVDSEIFFTEYFANRYFDRLIKRHEFKAEQKSV